MSLRESIPPPETSICDEPVRPGIVKITCVDQVSPESVEIEATMCDL